MSVKTTKQINVLCRLIRNLSKEAKLHIYKSFDIILGIVQ